MKPFNIDPLEAAVFACGFLLAIMLVRTIKARKSGRPTAGVANHKTWMPAAIALGLLIALWFWLS